MMNGVDRDVETVEMWWICGGEYFFPIFFTSEIPPRVIYNKKSIIKSLIVKYSRMVTSVL